MAQSNLPNFNEVGGTQLTNTNGQWITVNSAQPNNIDLLESQIFRMPAAEQGILGVEFKLVGGDGGTAHYESGAYNTFANGGRGGEVNFTLNLQNTTHYDKPFLVTFGKKGESVKFGSGMYVSAGGGGSTGMAWLVPGMDNKNLNKKWGLDAQFSYAGQLIAGAGGGSGGYADGYSSVHGKNATRDASGNMNSSFSPLDIYKYAYFNDIRIIAGGSGLTLINPDACCTTEFKSRQASSQVYNKFEYKWGTKWNKWGQSDGIYLASVTQGQLGGKPTTLYPVQEGTSNTNNTGVAFSLNQNEYPPVIKLGGRGGSGMAGGGAGSSTTDYFNGWVISFPSQRRNVPTSGAGGSASMPLGSFPHDNLETADDGYNDYSPYLQNVSISPRSNTNNPQSGYLMYRTIVDNESPVVHINQLNININSDSQSILSILQPYIGQANGITDNDGIKSVVVSPTHLACNQVGQTIPVGITVTDFAGNGTSTAIYITISSIGIVPVLPETSPQADDPDLPGRIDVSNGPVTLTAANFPHGISGCSITGITTHFPPTSFSCLLAGTQQSVTYYYTDSNGSQSPNYTKTFNIVYSGGAPAHPDIDVTPGPVALTASHFGGCANSPGVTIHYPPTTFDCIQTGTQQVTYYLTDNYGNQSPDYTMTFNILYSISADPKLYVDATATGSNNGLSWENAFTSLQDAINRNGCLGEGKPQIYVAQGTYRPDIGEGITANDRNASFNIKDLKIYGGFPSGGGDFADRNPSAHPTTLSGEIGTAAANDNSYHVVEVQGNAELDGFTIRDGYFDATNGDWGGSGLYINMVSTVTDSIVSVLNCNILNNYSNVSGGAIAVVYPNIGAQKSINFTNCLFKDNSAASVGGAIFLAAASGGKQSFINCAFNSNQSIGGFGGAMYLSDGSINDMTNCTFANNTAVAVTGGIYNRGTVNIRNSIFYNNSQNAIANAGPGSASAAYSNVQGSGGSQNWSLAALEDKGNNIDANPLFYSTTALSLTPQSPSRNAGLNSYNNEPVDIAHNDRIIQDVIDMGAYELGQILYVAADAPSGGDGNSWATAINNLNEAIPAANLLGKDIWIKHGVYKPDRAEGSNTVTLGNRNNTFHLSSSLKIYGGFAGTETSVAQRNIGESPTILSGDMGIAGNITDNAYHVITMVAGEHYFDGLIIEGGNADHATDINKNRGGGIFEPNQSSGANNVFINCVFRNNRAAENGGGMHLQANVSGSSTFSQCLFYNNTAIRGAASFIKMNTAGAEVYDQKLYHVTVANNVAIGGSVTGAFEAEEMAGSRPANITFYNSLLAGNTPSGYSDLTNPGHITLSNTYHSASNTGIFVNSSNAAGADGNIMTADDGLQLLSSSPAINYGDNTLIYSGTDKDITGNQRIINNVDAGAYESVYSVPLVADDNGIIYVKLNASGNGTSWANPTGDLHKAIQAAGVQKVFVAVGTYKVGEHSFIMKNGVGIYGGFDPENNITDLSHQRIMPDATGTKGTILHGESVRPVIWNVFTAPTALNNTAVLDGFMITKGSYSNGAGVRNIYASPTLRNLVIAANQATISGGGMYNSYSSPLVSNSLIVGNVVINTAPGGGAYGAGVININSSAPVFTNITATTNLLIAPSGTAKGAGIYNIQANPQIYNSIFWYNQKNGIATTSGSDIENDQGGYITLKNSITQVYATGNTADNNKVGVNPQFENNYSLKTNSPAIDAGSNALYAGLDENTKDLADNPRVFDFTGNKLVDIGAYEYQCTLMDFSQVVFEDVELDYDGNPHSIAVQSMPDGATVTYEITDMNNQTVTGNAATSAGIYTIKATMSATGAGCSVQTRTAVLSIAKIPAVITTAGVQSYVYDGIVKNVAASLNHTEASLTYEPQQGYTEAGSYWVTVSAPVTDNYLAVSENIALVIENKELTGISLNDAAFTYDGEPKSLTITGTLPNGAILVYGGNEMVDVGTYTVGALIQLPNYNDLWLTATMTINSALPVRWISFDGKLDDSNHAKLDWKVDQTSVAGYQIERSNNAKDFRIVGSVVSATGDGISQYSFTDPVAAVGTVYYRIRQTDLDGTYSYSRIISLTGPEGVQLMVYPNPTGGKVTVQVSPEYLGTWLKLINSSGILVKQVELKGQTLEIPLDNYPAGIYILYSWDGRAFKIIKN